MNKLLLLIVLYLSTFSIECFSQSEIANLFSSSAVCDSSVQWQGSVDSSFATTNNWGVTPCIYPPSCTIDAIIAPAASGRQPIISGNATVKDLRIDSGGVLHINSGAILNVCGSFTNHGSLICDPGSTVRFIGQGQGSQTINGLLTGVNSFANLEINKTAGYVVLNANTDVSQNFTTIDSTSIFDINGKYMKVGGNFTNSNGNATFRNVDMSTVEFNGSTNQNFTNLSDTITFCRVTMNKPFGKLYLTGLNSTMNIDTALVLAKGIIVTRSISSLEVNMKYYLHSSITSHNVLSYIDGKLRRKISNGAFSSPPIPASYDFPVGDSLTPVGYELANIFFTQATLVYDLQATFTHWPAGAPSPGPVASECLQETYSNKPIFDNGYWTFIRTGTNVSGKYNITLYNTGVTNNTGLGWTVAKSDTMSNPSLPASWNLTGNCKISSTAAATVRININPAPGVDSLCFNHNYATVQTDNAIPVEELYFKNISGIELYPNPASSIINYSFSYSIDCELIESVCDVSGRIVRKEKIKVVKGMNHITKKIDDLASGVYNLRISGTNNESVILQVQFLKN